MKQHERMDQEFYPKRETYLKISAELFKLVSETHPPRAYCTQEEITKLLTDEGITSAREVARALDWLVKHGYLGINGSRGYTVNTIFS